MCLRWFLQSSVSHLVTYSKWVFSIISRHLTHCVNFTGPGSSNLSRDTLVKLKAVYTLVEQLYTRAQWTLATISPANQGPNLLSDVLKKLCILPTRFQEIKRSCSRVGAITALSRAKAWVLELDPADVASGYPSLKEDGTPFDQEDFAACVKEIRPHATIVAEETNLTKYQPGYNADNQKDANSFI